MNRQSLGKMNALEKLSLVTLRISFGMCMYICPLNVCVVLCKTSSNCALCLTTVSTLSDVSHALRS